MEDLLTGFDIGAAVWFVTWGLNRIWLTFKTFVS